MILPVILAGGYGERLWPLSRQSYPKQFLSLLTEETSLLQDTIMRLPQSAEFLPPLVICNEDHRFLVAEQLRTQAIATSAILLEPVARGTAFAIALAAYWAQQMFNIPVTLLALPADHVIGCNQQFAQAIAAAYQLAQENYLVTFGIPASRPETGYGYILAGEPLAGERLASDVCAYKIAKFIEKPSLSAAEQLIAGNPNTIHWNSGMFMFTVNSFLAELKLYQPQIAQAAQAAIENLTVDNDFSHPASAACHSSPKISIDYGIMEQTKQAVVVPLHTSWSDIGNWHALWQHKPKDANNNVVNKVMNKHVIALETTNSLINTQDHLVATYGIDNMIIVATKDATLVTTQDNAANIKNIVAQLKHQQTQQIVQPYRVHRPWGWYESISSGTGFQVKLISVAVGKKLSLQLHHHRSEHWVVVNGSAKVTCGYSTFLLAENQSTYIPIGIQHRLENAGKIPLIVIEVQSGSYLGEDDIVRFQDEHGREVVTAI